MFISKKTTERIVKSLKANAAVVGVIDIGSSSIRMEISQIDKKGKIESIERFERTVLFGRDTFTKGYITKKTMQQAMLILREFAKTLELYKVDHSAAVATSAIREAANSDIFVDKALMAAGLDVRVIDTCEQSRLIAVAQDECVRDEKINSGDLSLIAEAGGGSTVLVLTKNNSVILSQALRLGSIRLLENFELEQDIQEAKEYIDTHIINFTDSIKSVVELSKIHNLTIIGSDARFIADIQNKGDWGKYCHITVKKFTSAAQNISLKTVAELVSNYGITYSNAQTLRPSLLIYERLAKVIAVKKINILPVTMRDGLILEAFEKVAGISSSVEHSETINSAMAIAGKYKVYDQKTERTTGLCEKLFEVLKPLHKLEKKYCIILQVAAILHRVGTFISSSAYHKHSHYIIRNCDIFGLNETDNAIAALIARYHRKSTPKNTHREYISLDKNERVAVNKMAAILRFAISLSAHNVCEKDLSCELIEADLKINISQNIAQSIHLLAGSEKMLEEVFCISVKIRQE